jgi:hypothetical protein
MELSSDLTFAFLRGGDLGASASVSESIVLGSSAKRSRTRISSTRSWYLEVVGWRSRKPKTVNADGCDVAWRCLPVVAPLDCGCLRKGRARVKKEGVAILPGIKSLTKSKNTGKLTNTEKSKQIYCLLRTFVALCQCYGIRLSMQGVDSFAGNQPCSRPLSGKRRHEHSPRTQSFKQYPPYIGASILNMSTL